MECSATINVDSYFVIKLFYKHLYLLKSNGLRKEKNQCNPQNHGSAESLLWYLFCQFMKENAYHGSIFC